jgi:hypothetical protein
MAETALGEVEKHANDIISPVESYTQRNLSNQPLVADESWVLRF